MGNTLKKILHGEFGQVGTTEDDIVDLVNPRVAVPFNILAAGAEQIIPLLFPRVALTLMAAYVVPSVTTTKDGTDFITIVLSKGDMAGTGLTALDSMDTDTGGDNLDLTAFTKRSFTVVPSTDSIAADAGWYLTLTQDASGKDVSGIVVLEYERVN